jgi:hypothetical protein
METEILIEQTADQLRMLLAEQNHNGFVARYLIENRERVDEVFDRPLDALFSEMEGSPAAGFEIAGRSYLESGFYDEAEGALTTAIELGCTEEGVERLSQYARGMAAYLAGNYSECVLRLSEWFDGRRADEEDLLEIARAAVSKIDQLAEGDDRDRVAGQAAALIERIGPGVPAEQLGTGI